MTCQSVQPGCGQEEKELVSIHPKPFTVTQQRTQASGELQPPGETSSALQHITNCVRRTTQGEKREKMRN